MKKIYSVCLILMAVIFSASYYISYQLTLNKQEENRNLLAQTEVESILAADNNSDIIVNKNMKLIKESYDLDSKELTEETETIPVDLLGLTREEVIDYLQELSKDGKTYELLSFSSDSIKIREMIQALPPEYTCYLINENGYLIIYDKSMGDSYVTTYIPIEDFPLEEQEVLMDGKGFESMIELYNYLESHTS